MLGLRRRPGTAAYGGRSIVKLLFDANISPRLVDKLEQTYPGSAHVMNTPDLVADDKMIWDYAKSFDFVIVSKDLDFLELSLLHGPPPKVIFLRLGNCPTEAIERSLRSHQLTTHPFFVDPDAGLLILDR